LAEQSDLRVIVAFGILGVIAVVLAGRLTYLQVGRAAPNHRSVELQRGGAEVLPAPRGTIVDRNGELLAYDRPVIEVRAEAYPRLRQGQEAEDLAEFARLVGADLAFALSANVVEGRLDQRQRVSRLLAHRIRSSGRRYSGKRLVAEARDGEPAVYQCSVDFLVDRAVDSAPVLARLDACDRSHDRLYLHKIRRFAREYPNREATWGSVGFAGKRAVADGNTVDVYRGMEAFGGLRARSAGTSYYWRDARARRYWLGVMTPPSRPVVVQSTLDIGLQKAATEELAKAVAVVSRKYHAPPDWGALCLAEIATGDILAMASFRASATSPAAGAFAPTQCLFEPGSVVKPLLFSLALERGAIDWFRHEVDCAPRSASGWRIPGTRRRIKDSHSCGILLPHDILVQSSNIGAVKVGLLLGREGMEVYLDQFGFGTATGTHLPEERSGTVPSDILGLSDRQFTGYTGASLCFGYELSVTPLQLMRAYLTLLSRRPRELRLTQRYVVEGEITELGPDAVAAPFLSPRTLALLVEAMRGVVSDQPGATGALLARELADLGVPSGVVAGKTGTSQGYQRKRGKTGAVESVMVRTATFAGFAPADQPRYVAVCVLQKTRASAFWGGHYAAPSAGRLLIRALEANGSVSRGLRVSAASGRPRGPGQPGSGR